MNEIFTKQYTAPAVDRREALRYAGVRSADEEYGTLLNECLDECLDALSYKVCYGEFPVARLGNGEVDLGFTRVSSSMLGGRLEGCDRAIVFAATLGLGIDRIIARAGRTAPSRAVILQGIGAERIEALCDAFCDEVRAGLAKGEVALPRISPGYSDLPLQLQADIFSALDCGRKIGLYLNESMLMSPTKSVTAIIGIRGA